MLRIVRQVGALALAVFALSEPAFAQASGGWTLNINNRFGGMTVPAGGELPYDVRITNNENFVTPAGSIDFAIPATTIFQGVTGLANCSPAPTMDVLSQPLTVTCDVPELDPGEDLLAEVLVSPMVGECEGRNCVITLDGRIYDPSGATSAEATASRSTTITVGADLAFSVRLDEDVVQAGSMARFTASVSNRGPYPSTGSQIVIPMPAGMSNARVPGSCSLVAENIVCEVPGPLNPGETHEVVIQAQVEAGNVSTISIAGRVEGAAPRDAVAENDGQAVDLTILPGTDVRLEKNRSPGGLLLVGDEVEFELVAAFSGIEPTRATIIDEIPANYDFASGSPVAVAPGSGWTCRLEGRTVVCDYVVGAGTDFTSPITIAATAARITGENGVVNTATISSPDENADAPAENNIATDLRADIQEPIVDLRAHKSGPDRNLVTVGNSYGFTLRAENVGNKRFADEVTITDHLPEGLSVTQIDAPAGWICPAPTSAAPIVGPAEIVCSTNKYASSPLPVGSMSDTIAITATVTQGGIISNGMTVSFPDYLTVDANPADNTTSVDLGSANEENWSDIGVRKAVSPSSVNSGEEVTFSIEIFNEGPRASTNIQITDRLSDLVGTSFGGQPGAVDIDLFGGLADGFNCQSEPSGNYGRNLQCTIQELPKCQIGVDCPRIEIKARVGSQGAKENIVYAYSLDVPDNDLSNNSSTAPYQVTPITDVQVIKASPAALTGANAGQNLIYTVTAQVPDTGLSQAENVVITDTLPAGVIFVSASPSTGACSVSPSPDEIVTPANNQIVCEMGTIRNGSQETLTVVVLPMTDLVGQEIINRADVSTTSPETNPDNNSTVLPILVVAPILDLVIDKTDDPFDPVEIKTPTTYRIKTANAGPSDAFNVVITDTLPTDGFRDPQIVATSEGLQCAMIGTSETAAGGEIVCTQARLRAGDEISLDVQMTSFKRGNWLNRVTVTSDEVRDGYEGPATNNTAVEDTTVRTRADVGVVKTPSLSIVDLREEFSWDIVVTAHAGEGLDVAEQVTLTDTLPAGMELTRLPEIVAGTGVCHGGIGQRQIDCELGDIEAGETVTIRLYTKITDKSAESASNTAIVDTASFDYNTSNNTSTGSVATVRGSSVSGKIYKDHNNDGVLNQPMWASRISVSRFEALRRPTAPRSH